MNDISAPRSSIAPICVRERDFIMQTQGFAGRPEGTYDQCYVQVDDPALGVSVTNDSARARGDVFNVRHRHPFSQVRYFIRGHMNFGRDKALAGDVQFVGDSVSYGPMTSTPDPEPVHFLQTQFQGPSGIPWLDKAQLPRIQEELAKSGSFDKGIYHPNGGRPMDSLEAITIAMTENKFELTGTEKITYPPQQVLHPVYVHTPQLQWRTHSAGIEVKHVMYLFDTGPNVKLVRMAKGAVLPAGLAMFQQTRWLLEGAVTWQDSRFESLSMMFYPPTVKYPETRSDEDGTVILIIQWTNLGAPEIPFAQL